MASLLMVVALAAVCLSAGQLYRRRCHFLSEARRYELLEQGYQVIVAQSQELASFHRGLAKKLREAVQNDRGHLGSFLTRRTAAEAGEEAARNDEAEDGARQQVRHYAAMKRKYENAAASPWLSVTPDPPPPG